MSTPTNSKSPILVLGGGPNGLAAAAVLAKKGRAVTVLEARETLGGLAAAEEFHPGYTAPGTHLDSAEVRPWVLDTLGINLERRPRAEVILPSKNGKEIHLRPDAEDGLSGDIEARDRESWRDFHAFLHKIRPILVRVMDRPPPGSDDSLASHLGTAWSVRKLGKGTMHDFLRILPMSLADWLRDSFSNERLRAGLCLPALSGSFTGPLSPHSGLRLLIQESLAGGDVVGGPAAVARKLEAAAKAAGATLRKGAVVSKILVGKQGVTGVRLQSGEELPAGIILSTLDPKQTFHSLIGPPWLPLSLDDAARVYRMRGTTAVVRLALSAPLVTRAGTKVCALRTGETIDDIERAFDAAKYKACAEVPALDVRVPSVADPSLCPSGHAVVTIFAHTAAYNLLGGYSEAARAALKNAVLNAITAVCPTVRDTLVAAQVLVPTDIESLFRVTNGHLGHGELAPDQFLSFRPAIVAGHYATPIAGLFLGGGSAHPGGGLHLCSGTLAAQTILGS